MLALARGVRVAGLACALLVATGLVATRSARAEDDSSEKSATKRPAGEPSVETPWFDEPTPEAPPVAQPPVAQPGADEPAAGKPDEKPAAEKPPFLKGAGKAVTSAPIDDDYDDRGRDAARPADGRFAMRLGFVASAYSWRADRVLMIGPHISLGTENKSGAFYFDMHLTSGQTEGSLNAWRFAIGTALEWPIGALRLGFNPRVGLFLVDRVTTPHELVNASIGGALLSSVDLFRVNGFAMALLLQPSVDLLGGVGGNSGLFGVSAGLDFRWRAGKRTPPRPVSAGTTRSAPSQDKSASPK